MEIKIDVLRINLADATGQEHRIRPITARATTILLEGLSERLDGWKSDFFVGSKGFVNKQPVQVNLSGMTDEQAAHHIAGEWLKTLALKLR